MSKLKVVILNGSMQQPSRTHVLCQALFDELAEHLPGADLHWVEISQIGRSLGACLQRQELPREIEADLQAIENADLLIAASPVYRATFTGLFKHLVDFLGMTALVNKPVLLAATGGSPLHGLMLDHQMRPLFAMMQALTLPIGVYATESDFSGDYELASSAAKDRVKLAVEMALPNISR
ncbi:FMN reductase [Reinekea marinisedimentorum]|uniref:FMN reductase n=1 Tax=Reinekea marinisedimentorum TaxID=230495 RepID=A0A4R3HZ23_9GAMM|nr:FMN reductase [Reinekea marinisedimentorum]TCS37581.1 FMN reductase [Reinekea marinisedimentorum]